MKTMYSMTSVMTTWDQGLVEGFTTNLYMSEAEVRRSASEDFKIPEDQLIIGETMYRVADFDGSEDEPHPLWFNDEDLANEAGDIDLHLRIDMHVLP